MTATECPTDAEGLFDRVSAVGTHRRIQALQAVGWSLNSISRELGTTPSTLRYLLAGRSINTARRNGWPPPLAWDACDHSSQAVYLDASAARRAGDRHTDTHRSTQ